MISTTNHKYNQWIIEQLVRHSIDNPSKYTILHIAEIIRRTMQGARRDESGIFASRIPTADLYEKHGIVETITCYRDGSGHPSVSCIEEDGRRLVYEGTLFPGRSYGKKLYEALGRKIRQIDIGTMSDDAFYVFVARIAITLNAIHAFGDGNGRVTRGIVAYFILLHKKRIITNECFLENKQNHDEHLIIARHALLPGKYNSIAMLDEMKKSGETERHIIIPLPWNALRRYVRGFMMDFREMIHQFIRNIHMAISSDTRHAGIDYQTRQLAEFYCDNSHGYQIDQQR